jgi:hypothetical protein
VLRATGEERDVAYASLVDDLGVAAETIRSTAR